MDIAEIHQKGVENDFGTLRIKRSALMDGIDSISETLEETRDIALANQSRLDRVEQIGAENRALILENRGILLAIADHIGLLYQVPPRSPQSD